MRSKYLLLFALFIFAGAGTALASSAPVDPSIILRDPAACPKGTTCQTINMSNFTFFVSPTGGGLFDFTDNLGVNITSLTFIFVNPGGIDNGNIGSAVNCQVLAYFDNCSKSVLSNGSIEILFSGIGGEGCSGDSDDNAGNEGSDSDGGNNGHNECNGILNGSTFTLDLFNQKNGKDDCNKKTGVCTGGWVSDSSVAGIANVPEPGTLLLLLTGIPLFALRKRN
jgi:hypothetical protein